MIIKRFVLFVLIAFGSVVLPSCAKKDPSVLKVFVRSSDFILTEGAKVRIVADINKDTPEYFDEKTTNSSGVAIFTLDELFDEYSKKESKVAYFTVYAKDTVDSYTIGKARAKAYLTSTETIVLEK